jgi:hypothetical protein
MGISDISLILAEIVTSEPLRQFRNEMFPFFQGFSRELGIKAVWIKYGISFNPDLSTRYFADLEDRDIEHLADKCAEQKATHLLFNESLSRKSFSLLKEKTKNIKILCLGDLLNIDNAFSQFHGCGAFIKWLDLDPEGDLKNKSESLFIDIAQPDYSNEAGNQKAQIHPPFLKLLCGLECRWKTKLSSNPFFLDIKDQVPEKYGCSFCGSGGIKTRQFTSQLMDLVFRQLRAIRKSRLQNKKMQQIMVIGEGLFRNLEDFLENLIKEGFSHLWFLFSIRADDLLSKKHIIEKWLPVLKINSIVLHFNSIGVENFSLNENLRFNKGISSDMIRECAEMISHWESAYPDTFECTRYGGFSFILFTPWTTTDDLEINHRWFRKLGFHQWSGFIRSRLQLLEGRPITVLARKEGLVIESPAEPLFDSGCITSWHLKELPWRFKNEEVAVIYRIAYRIFPESDELASEPFYIQIQEWVKKLPPVFKSPQELFPLIIKTVKENRQYPDVQLILEKIASRAWNEISKEHRSKSDETEISISTPLARFLKEKITSMEAEQGSVAGTFCIEEITRGKRDEDRQAVRLVFQNSKGDRFSFFIEPRKSEISYYAFTEKYGISFYSDSPVDSSDKKEIISAVVQFLKSRECN